MFRTINIKLLSRFVIIVNVENLSAVNKNEFMAPKSGAEGHFMAEIRY
jgi:hypothetical protein